MSCPLCSYSKTKKVFISYEFHGHHQINKNKIPIYYCSQCHCYYPKIKVDKNFYQRYYLPNYRHHSGIFEAAFIGFSLFIKNILSAWATAGIPKPKVLDVGCGQAEYLKNLPPRFVKHGVDINAPKISGLKTESLDFLQFKSDFKYDLITFWHSLEHFPQPQTILLKAFSLLSKQGKLIIALPNTNSLSFRLFKNNWFHLDPPRHLFLPNPQNISRILPHKYRSTLIYPFWDFPLDLFWSAPSPFRFLLIPFYPLLKLISRDTFILIISKN